MNIRLRAWCAAIACLAGVAAPNATLAQGQPTTLKLGHILSDQSLYHASARLFADALASCHAVVTAIGD